MDYSHIKKIKLYRKRGTDWYPYGRRKKVNQKEAGEDRV